MIGIAEAAERWRLDDVRPIAETSGSLVFRARNRDRGFVITKILKPRGMGELAGMDYLDWRDGHGAVRLLAREHNACLLEDAGTRTLEDFRDAEGEPAAADVFAATLRQLHAPSPRPFPNGLVPLERQFSSLLDTDRTIPTAHAANMEWAAATARELLTEQTHIMPLHGDLHHENILADKDGQWRVIDPHGLVGDPAYDAANFFGNPLGRPDITCDAERIQLLANRLAPAVASNPDKVLRYAATHAALSACWSIDDPVSDGDSCDAAHRLTFLSLVRSMID